MSMLGRRVKLINDDVPSLNRFKKGDAGLVVKIEDHVRGGYDHTVHLDKYAQPLTFQEEELELEDETEA